uniref:ArfGAP with GTPase domain, ankyrin repeat and PH domain 3 n=1 Tax=Nomascus leucogenys TaxID=61853 RepID=A0A2I3HF05_NOMLE
VRDLRAQCGACLPGRGPEGSGLAKEAATGHRALQVTAQLAQPLGSVRRLHPGRAHQPGHEWRRQRLQRLLVLSPLHPQHQPAGAAHRDHRCLLHPHTHPKAVQAALQHLHDMCHCFQLFINKKAFPTPSKLEDQLVTHSTSGHAPCAGPEAGRALGLLSDEKRPPSSPLQRPTGTFVLTPPPGKREGEQLTASELSAHLVPGQ